MPNLVLTGFMGTGKTTVGRRVASRLGLKFVDTDAEIEKVTDLTIAQIFKKHGEIRFRSEEAAAIRRIVRRDRQVIATGGGAVMTDENLALLKEYGFLICLTADPEVIYERVKSKRTRPLLQTDNPLETIKQMLFERMPVYNKADALIDTSNLSMDEVVDRVLVAFKELESKRGS